MKNTACLIVILILTFANVFSQNKVLFLKNATGIVEDNLGSVIRWENQINGYGDALQTDSTVGGDQLQETYPGKVNVGFSKEGSHLVLDDSNKYVLDNSFSVFYVGKVGEVSSVASLFGNFRVDNNAWNNSSGVRFTRKPNGEMTIQYGKPSYQQIVLSNLPENEFFFFGFSVDSSGNYRYFDNSSTTIKTGALIGSILQNNDNIYINLARQATGNFTYDQTEVAELLIYDDQLSLENFQNEFNRLSTDYKELVKQEFMVSKVLPAERTNLLATEKISIVFTQDVAINSSLPKIYANKSTTEVAGNWSLSSSNTLTFTPNQNWPFSALVSVQIQGGLKSTNAVAIDISKRSKYDFIVESENTFGSPINSEIASMATVDYPVAGHVLPLRLTLPSNREKKVPVHIWVHGGGWSGGTAAKSVASYSPHGDYLAEKLGVATLGIAYRCSGSSGTFSLAMEDIDKAYQWALANADTYNFDMTKVFFSGGSAGTPLAALASQRYSAVIGFIGFNGIYDFVNDAGDFGTGNSYKQNVPTEEYNSPIFQLRSTPAATILMHGDADTTIAHKQSTLFADAITAKGGKANAVIYPGEVHAFFNAGQQAYEDVLYEMAAFMRDVLEEAPLSVNDFDKKKENRLTAYPNPVKKGGILKIEFDSKPNTNRIPFQVINYLGQVVIENTAILDSNTLTIDTICLAKGNYILKMNFNQKVETVKFLIH